MSSPVEQQKHIGKGMTIAMWIIILGLLTLFFNKLLDNQYNPNQNLKTQMAMEGNREVVLQRNRFGHYVANGTINNQPVVFLLDTGATDISIPATVARRLGLRPGRKLVFQTANGTAYGYATRLESVSLGAVALHNLPASINPNVNHDEILLGMSFLKHIEFTQKGDTLTLRQ